MVKRQFINAEPRDLPAHAPRDAVKVEFAKRLQRAFTHKGWNQSELARRAAVYVPEGGMGRDVISTYVRGKSLPGPIHLTAICKALGVEPDDLLPSRGMPSAGADSPPLDMRDIGEGKVWLRINQSVDWSVAVRIINVLKGE